MRRPNSRRAGASVGRARGARSRTRTGPTMPVTAGRRRAFAPLSRRLTNTTRLFRVFFRGARGRLTRRRKTLTPTGKKQHLTERMRRSRWRAPPLTRGLRHQRRRWRRRVHGLHQPRCPRCRPLRACRPHLVRMHPPPRWRRPARGRLWHSQRDAPLRPPRSLLRSTKRCPRRAPARRPPPSRRRWPRLLFRRAG